MRCNVGGMDRTGRFILGGVLIILNLAGVLGGTLALVAWVVAAIAIGTALIRFCPANMLLAVNTCRRDAG